MAITKVRDLEKGKEDEITEPLLYPELKEVSKDISSDDDGDSAAGSIGPVVLTTAFSVFGSFEYGMSVGFTAPTQAEITHEFGLSLSEFSLFGSIVTIGAMLGAITSGRIADLIGRKGAMRTAALFCILGWICLYFAMGTLMLDVGRFSTGYGVGVLSYVIPVFIAEISPKHLRGCLTSIDQLLICSGGSVAYIVGSFVTWRQLVLFGLFPCVVFLFGLFLIPESPRWLARTGRHKEFKSTLQWLRGQDANISKEVTEIEANIEALQSSPEATLRDLCKKAYIRPLIIAGGLLLFQQLGGVNGIGFYASEIFLDAGFPSAKLGNILMGSIQVPVTILGSSLIDKGGRRFLLVTSATGTFIGCFLTGTSFYLKSHGLHGEWGPMLALTGLLVYVGMYSFGMGAVPWVIMSEIFPLNVKGIAGSLATLLSWFGTWAISYAFNFLMSWSASGTFYLFAAGSATTILFVVFVVPETKGRTLEEIQESMKP